jgi:dethiobiotin synthetase
MRSKKVFVAGTDTGVGKTLVTAILMAGMDNGFYWKPIQCGTRQGTDTRWVREMTGLSADRFFPEAFRLKHPLPPMRPPGTRGCKSIWTTSGFPPRPINWSWRGPAGSWCPSTKNI